MKPVIEIRNVSKKYVFGLKKPSNLLQDKIVGLIKPPAKVLPVYKKINGLKENEFWALKNISFNVMPGEVIGIIGKNGAGKSTLLKILSQITLPTEGEIILRGRVASLLEVGTGFHPELTGRENIYLNGAILGMKRVEIKKKFDQIVQFAEIEKFLDTPVKHYSSGMYMRLAFAVAAHLEPEILLVDEVLAVGDAEFQKKCLGKMKNVAGSGTTVLFVSHNMETVENLCTKCLLIQKGIITTSGNVEDVVRTYLNKDSKNVSGELKSGPITLTLKTLTPKGEYRNTFQVGKGVLIKAIINSEIPLAHADFGVGIADSFGIRICTFHTQYQLKDKLSFKKKCQLIIDWKEIIILPGLYKFVAAVYEKGELIAHWEDLDQFNIVAADYYKTGKLPNPSHQGKILVKNTWKIIKD